MPKSTRRGGSHRLRQAGLPLALLSLVLLLLDAFAAAPAAAAEVGLNSGDTAWVMVSGILVLVMTIPGLALFYGGMVRKKNVLATMMQSFAITAFVSVIWLIGGYSLAFGEGNGFIGDFSKLFLQHLAVSWDQPLTLGGGRQTRSASASLKASSSSSRSPLR